MSDFLSSVGHKMRKSEECFYVFFHAIMMNNKWSCQASKSMKKGPKSINELSS